MNISTLIQIGIVIFSLFVGFALVNKGGREFVKKSGKARSARQS